MPTKYELIQNELYRRIQSGEYTVGQRLPPDQDLADAFTVNRHTVRRALGLLADEGYVQRAPGRGTVVASRTGGEVTAAAKLCYRVLAGAGDFSGWRIPTAERLASRFNDQHPLADVEVKAEPYGLWEPSGPAAVAGPDPIVSRFTYMADYARSNMLLPLDEFDDLLDVASPLDGRLVYRTQDGFGEWHIHALPVQLGAWMLLVNRSLTRRLGVEVPSEAMTWLEFTNICDEIGKKGADEGIRAISLELRYEPQFMTRFFPYFYSANGGELLVDPQTFEPNLTADGNEQFLEFLMDLREWDLCEFDEPLTAFHEGRCAFRLSVTTGSALLEQNRQRGEELDVLPIPKAEPTSADYTVVRGEFVGILAQTVNSPAQKQAAWEFTKFLLSRQSQIAAFREAGDLPVRTGLAPTASYDPGPAGKSYRYGQRAGLPTFDVPRNLDVHRVIQRAMTRAMTKACKPKQALQEAQEMLSAYASTLRFRQTAGLDPSLIS